ncbi:C-5 cytosine-specific DNA methylase [Actinoplanes cyaneus]|nr:C-5 cytosine-specific DNA methylase [Actinoplanes cyaneus]
MGVDAMGVADAPPQPGATFEVGPKLTCEMVARIQGWSDDYEWTFTGRKTSRYRQIGNAFPPPVAAAVGTSIMRALRNEGDPAAGVPVDHDPIYLALRKAGGFVTQAQLIRAVGGIEVPELERRIGLLSRDFDLTIETRSAGPAYQLGGFKAFVGQSDHLRHDAFQKNLSSIS